MLSISKSAACKKKSQLKKKPVIDVSQETIILPLIETTHYKNIQLLLVAKGLENRGYRIVVVVCASGLDLCETRSVKISASKIACYSCGLNLKIIEHFGFEIIHLNSPKYNRFDLLREEYLDEDYKNALNDSTNRYFFGDLPENDKKVQGIRKRYLNTLSKTDYAASVIFNQYQPKILLAYMMVYVENYPWVAHAKKRNVRIAHVSNTQFNENAQTLNFWDLYRSDDRYEGFLSHWGKSNSKQENTELDNYLAKRFSGNLLSKNLNLSHKTQGKLDTLKKLPFLDAPEKKCVILFPNILWDSGMSVQNTIFESIEDWLVRTVNLLADQDEYIAVVKCHPQERLYTNKSKTSKDVLLRHFNNTLPDNIHIIDYESEVSSYDLFDFMDICCVFNGTIGLEALLCGKQVIAGGKAPYGDLTFSKSIESRKEYYDLFSKICQFDNSVEQEEEIRRFAYFYFLKSPIPWNLTEKAVGGSYYGSIKNYNIENTVLNGGETFEHLLNCIEDETLIPENWVQQGV